jgi:hypothetical protein
MVGEIIPEWRATSPGIRTNDLYLDEKGGIARVSGLNYFLQRVRDVLSMQRGESPFSPTFGMRFFEYFEAYRGSPWLDLLFKLYALTDWTVEKRGRLVFWPLGHPSQEGRLARADLRSEV